MNFKTRSQSFLLLVVLFSLILSSCSILPKAASTPLPVAADSSSVLAAAPSSPPPNPNYDPCAKENVKNEALKYSRALQNFDQVSTIALAAAKGDLVQLILNLQTKREAAAAVSAPVCLANLQKTQLDFMNAVIVTLTHFMAGGTSEQVQNEIGVTRNLRLAYEEEFAKILEVPFVTATPQPTLVPLPTSTLTPITATTEQDLYTSAGPSLDYPQNGTFLRGQTVNVAGRSEKNDWVQIELADQTGVWGWVPIALIKLSGSQADLPLILPPATP